MYVAVPMRRGRIYYGVRFETGGKACTRLAPFDGVRSEYRNPKPTTTIHECGIIFAVVERIDFRRQDVALDQQGEYVEKEE